MFLEKIKVHLTKPSIKILKRGEILYNEGDSPQALYFIETGLVGLFHISETGKETFLRVFGGQAILGHRSYFAKEVYHASAVALAETKVLQIPKTDADRIFSENLDLLKDLTQHIARDLGAAELRLAGLQDKSAPRRVAESLVYLKLKYPEQVWNRKQIADYAGTTIETVTRVMSDLEKKQLLIKVGRDFTLQDAQNLLENSFY